jgi:hypothetical protein
VKEPSPRRLKKYAAKCLRLKSYLQSPGDGRRQGRIPPAALLWALLIGARLRRVAFAAIEALVRSPARRALDVSQSFGNEALGYFNERLDPSVTPQAAVTTVRQAKRHKAFESPWRPASLSRWQWQQSRVISECREPSVGVKRTHRFQCHSYRGTSFPQLVPFPIACGPFGAW